MLRAGLLRGGVETAAAAAASTRVVVVSQAAAAAARAAAGKGRQLRSTVAMAGAASRGFHADTQQVGDLMRGVVILMDGRVVCVCCVCRRLPRLLTAAPWGVLAVVKAAEGYLFISCGRHQQHQWQYPDWIELSDRMCVCVCLRLDPRGGGAVS
jgi:hypothetical protein